MIFLFTVVNFVALASVYCHPQCLDSHPPFKPDGRVTICRSYSRWGCCTAQDDGQVKTLYRKALRTLPYKRQGWCRRPLRTVLCLKCHPWSAHIFNAESNPDFKPKLALPCLNQDFCARFLKNCRQAVKYIWGETMKARNISFRNFCHEAQIALNKDLCFPKIRKTLHRLKSSTLNNTAKGSLASKKGCLCVREVARDLRSPLALVHANDQTHRMFVVEQIGVIYVILPSEKRLKSPFMNITEKVLTSPAFGDERGLLGIAFHPKYRKNGRVFVYYTTTPKKSQAADHGRKWGLDKELVVVSEWKVSRKNPNQVDPKSEKIILTIDQPASNHNGGQLLFGIDKYLYIFPGDGGKAGDPFGNYGNGLNKSTLLGKVLRIDIDRKDGRKPYSIPRDNPFIHERSTRPEIFAYGARNMWRCSVDRGDRKGRIFCGDVGQNKYEEIDIIVKGGNYGWRGREGFKCYDKGLCKSPLLANEILPIHAYSHKVGQSIVGGYVYRGCNYPKMRGLYFFADTMNGRMFTLKANRRTGKWNSKEVCMGDSTYCTGPKLSGTYAKHIFSFGEDEAGELYILSTKYQNNEAKNGAVYQLMDPERRTDPSACKYKVKRPDRVNPSRQVSCRDKIPSSICERFNRKGRKYCIIYPKYMRRNCKRTCKHC